VRGVYRTTGFLGLYRGLSVRIVRNILIAATSKDIQQRLHAALGIKDVTEEILDQLDEEFASGKRARVRVDVVHYLKHLLADVLTECGSAALTYPLYGVCCIDACKTVPSISLIDIAV
jgi:hypothetical protein